MCCLGWWSSWWLWWLSSDQEQLTEVLVVDLWLRPDLSGPIRTSEASLVKMTGSTQEGFPFVVEGNEPFRNWLFKELILFCDVWCLNMQLRERNTQRWCNCQLPSIFKELPRTSKDFQGLKGTSSPALSTAQGGAAPTSAAGDPARCWTPWPERTHRRRGAEQIGAMGERWRKCFSDFSGCFKISRLFGLSLNAGVDEETLRHPAAPSQEGHWWTPGDNRECPKCGTEQPQTSKFCSECGWMLRIS